jgi:Putative transposase DNA-binding domain
MSQVLTVSCKLEVLPQQVEKLEAVLKAFASCCEYVNSNTPPNLTNQIAVQSLKSCHFCGVIRNRQGKKFTCINLACGWVGDADENGSKNISALGATINSPRGSSTLFCSLPDVVLRATENPNLSRQAG